MLLLRRRRPLLALVLVLVLVLLVLLVLVLLVSWHRRWKHRCAICTMLLWNRWWQCHRRRKQWRRRHCRISQRGWRRLLRRCPGDGRWQQRRARRWT